MKLYRHHRLLHKQKGAAALFTVVVLLVAITLIVIYSARVTIQEFRVSGNDARAKLATAKAEQGLNIALSNLKVTNPPDRIAWPWVACTDDNQAPCGAAFDSSWSYAELNTINNDCDKASEEGYCALYFSQTPSLNYASITVASEGHADFENASALVTQTVAKYNFFSNSVGQIPPIMTPTPSIGGNMTIIPNPNAEGASGRSNAISVRSSNAMAFPGAGSMQSCGALYDGGGDIREAKCVEPGVADPLNRTVDSFNQCGCSNVDINQSTGEDKDGRLRPYSSKDNFGADVRDSDPKFPDDMFEFFFGVPGTDWQTIKDLSKIYGSCSNEPPVDDDTNPGDIIWIEGDCTLGSNTFPDGQLGSRFTENGGRGPVILVVEGDLDVTGTEVHTWGIIYLINQDGVSDTDSDVKLTGTPYIHGALLADDELDIGNGSMTIMYDAEMLNAVRASEDSEINVATDIWLPRSGSWSDFLPAN